MGGTSQNRVASANVGEPATILEQHWESIYSPPRVAPRHLQGLDFHAGNEASDRAVRQMESLYSVLPTVKPPSAPETARASPTQENP